MNQVYKYLITTLIGVIIGAFMFKGCNSTPKPLEVIKTSIITKSDTIWSKDTTYLTKEVIKFRYIKGDTIYKPIYLDSTDCNRVTIYNDTIRTNYVDFYPVEHIQGILRARGFSYKLKVPITIKDSIFTTIIKYKEIPKDGTIVLSMGIIGSRSQITPMGYLQLKRSELGVGYDMINKAPTISFKQVLFSK